MGITVAIDAMGGDHGVAVTVPAALAFLRADPDSRVILVGDAAAIGSALQRLRASNDVRVRVEPASEVVGMDESPALAMRNKKDSSMRVSINLVDRGEADACVSAGNTGALMATARFVLKTLPGIDRPAIASFLPTRDAAVCVLDLGANVDCTPEHLLQFGIMGSALAAAVEGKPAPSVALLNIGSEDIKGNEAVKRASALLAASPLRFIGNIEGDDVYRGNADVVVCDGFVGNVFLKTSEGLAQMLGDFLKSEFRRNWLTRLSAMLALPVLRAFKRRFDHRRYNGACLLGLRGIVVKSHGSADVFGFTCAIQRAAEAARQGLVSRITNQLESLAPIPA